MIGTPREIVSFKLLGLWKANQLKIVIFDDADMTATTELIKSQIIGILPTTCQQLC